ncbi:MAG TPA: phosphoribosylformylglycinamidine synthase subunit PurQ [Planktothrix sp.]|jgi:phosphoribosylformylglycinamidine synthase
MAGPKALIITGDGINCDRETSWALNNSGFTSRRTHAAMLLDNPSMLSEFSLCAIPGGFSFGDEIASGKVLAVKLKEKLKDELYKFVEQGKLVIGICNGFQVLVQLGMLPHSEPDKPRLVSLMRNKERKFINRWVTLTVTPDTVSPFFAGMHKIDLPIRHGEGRLTLEPAFSQTMVEHDPAHAVAGVDAKVSDLIKARAPLRYDEDVNGSFDRIAALTNEKGNVMGMMPHPEAFVRWSQHPSWTARQYSDASTDRFGEGDAPGLRLFKNAAAYIAKG